MEGKVSQCGWYTPEFRHEQDVVAKGSVPSLTEETAQLAIIPVSKLLTLLPEKAPIGLGTNGTVTAFG